MSSTGDDGAAGDGHAHVETERAFDAPRRWIFPRLQGVGGVARVEPARTFTQTATYLDTLGLDLLRAKHTLRRRVGGHDAGWHLKKPRENGSRLEMAQPLGTSAGRVPQAFRDELGGIAAVKALVPVAVLRTSRTERRLYGTDDTELAVVADDSVQATVYLFGESIYRWREVEVELVQGDQALLEELTRALEDKGLRVSASQSKLGRALAESLAKLDRREAGARTAGDVVLDYVAAQVGVLQATEARVRADQEDAVHKARVATRRLRSALRTFRPLFDRSVTDSLRAEVRWLTGVLGVPRDAEVLLRRFRSMTDKLEPDLVHGSSVQRLQSHLQAEHDRGRAKLLSVLDSRRYERLLGALTDLLVHPPWQPAALQAAEQEIPGLVRKSAKAVRRAVTTAQEAPDPVARDEALHDVRKKIKAARYAGEAAADVVHKADQRTAAWTELQDSLGEYQDSVVARGVIEAVSRAARRSSEDTFTFGVLGERESAQARAMQAQSDTLLDAAHAASRRSIRAKAHAGAATNGQRPSSWFAKACGRRGSKGLASWRIPFVHPRHPLLRPSSREFSVRSGCP